MLLGGNWRDALRLGESQLTAPLQEPHGFVAKRSRDEGEMAWLWELAGAQVRGTAVSDTGYVASSLEAMALSSLSRWPRSERSSSWPAPLGACLD